MSSDSNSGRIVRALLLLFVLISSFVSCAACAESVQAKSAKPIFGQVDIGGGVVLHYAEEGQGAPVVFVHGSLSENTYWQDQVDAFSKDYRAIAYSRRYNFPNNNPPITGYSVVTDADDLAAFITKMHLGKVYLVGHSYGALTALFFAAKHPQMLRAVVLAEPPAVSLLRELPDEQASTGQAMFADIQKRMIEPMHEAFENHDADKGVGIFIDYVFNDPQAWAKMSPSDRADTMRDAHEWDVMMTNGTLFPEITPDVVRSIKIPVMIMSGDKSYRFLAYIDQELARLIPNNVNRVYPDAGHQMWYKYPILCRDDAEAFFRSH